MKNVSIPEHLKLQGASLYLERLGEGHPILMVHGGPGADSRYLRPQCDQLATLSFFENPIELIYYDQRGSERSPLDPGQPPGGYQTHVEDIEQIRLFLGDKKLTLFGYSWGGLLALLYALSYPQKVERLILVSPAPAWAGMREQMKKNLQEMAARPVVQQLRQDWLAQEDSLSVEQKRHYRFALAVAGYFDDPSRALELTPFRVVQKVEEAIWSSLGAYDLRPQLYTLQKIQTLIVHGKQDVIPIQCSKELAHYLDAHFVVLENCGHVPYIEGTESLWSSIQNFLQ